MDETRDETAKTEQSPWPQSSPSSPSGQDGAPMDPQRSSAAVWPSDVDPGPGPLHPGRPATPEGTGRVATWGGQASGEPSASWSSVADGGLGSSPPAEPVEKPPGGSRRPPQWLVVAIVAALVGAAAGAGIAEGLGTGSPASAPAIRVGSATPGPALAGGQSIPTIVKSVLPEVVSIDAKGPTTGEDQGTGMVISPTGEVVTNNHVIQGATTITVTLYNQTNPLPAILVGADPSNDLALLKMNAAPANLQPVTFGDSAQLEVGDALIAIGNALGLSAGTPTVTSGIVSALGRQVQAGDQTGSTETLSNLIQTDAAINSGNSGGPLVDSSGQVVGMNTAVASSGNGNAPAQNIGFAIPSETIEKLIPELRGGGTGPASKAYLGVYVTDVTTQLQQQFGLVPSTGALIERIATGSPADGAGLQPGDVIVSFNANPVASAADLTNAVQKASPGQSIPVTYWRGQQKSTVNVTLTASPAS